MKPLVTQSSVKQHYFSLFFREIKFIARSKVLSFCLIFYPIIIIIFFTHLFHQGILQQIPVSVVDLDRSTASRALIHKIAATPQIAVSERDSSLYDAKQSLIAKNIYGIIVIPVDYEKKLLSKESPEVTAFYNNQFMSLGSSLQNGYVASLQSLASSYQVQTMTTQGISRKIAEAQLSPIKLETHPLFNPSLSYITTLVNGAVPVIIQILIMLTMVYTLCRDKESAGGISVPMAMASGSYLRYFINKMLPYLLWFFMTSLLFDIILIFVFEVPIRGSLTVLYLGTILFIIAAQLWAAIFTFWLPGKDLNFGGASVFASPAFGFVGLFFPRIAMSWYALAWGAIIPATWFVEIRLDQTIRGHDFPYNLMPLLWLSLIIIVAYLLSVIRIHQLMKKGAKHV